MRYSNSLFVEDPFFDQLRREEYENLDKHHHVYLRLYGGNLCPKSLVLSHHALLLENILGNPHSSNPTSQKSTDFIEHTRIKILEFFNAQDYLCVFTPNASGALKIVGESYPFGKKSTLLLLSDNHNSVNGIREYCFQKGGTTKYIPVQYEDLQINESALVRTLHETPKGNGCNLFAYPAQSNASGVKHDFKWIEIAQREGFHVLLDAAAFVTTSKLDLSRCRPDFVSVSFYKIFGYPTGVGCLLIKKSSFHLLTKVWFAGGTVNLASVVSQDKFLKDGCERFEDGTLNYNNIPAVETGLRYIESIGLERISRRIAALTQYLIVELKSVVHDNGLPLVKIFGPESFDNRGGNVMMKFLDPLGNAYAFEAIELMTNANRISIRSGCFCNPGIDEINNRLTRTEISQYFQSRKNGDYNEMKSFLGKLRGATRVSVGLPTNRSDIDTFVTLIKSLRKKVLKQRRMVAAQTLAEI